MYILYFIISILSTTLGSITGMGGGVIIKPVLDMFGHYDVGSISMLSSITVFTMTLVSIIRQRRSPERPEASIAVPLSLGAALGGNIGSLLLDHFINRANNKAIVTVGQNIILSCLIVLVFLYMLKKDQLPKLNLKGIMPSIITGLLLGIISSFLGIGGGPINVAFIIFAFSFPIKTATVCSLLTILFSQASKLLIVLVTGGFVNYDLSMLPFMILGGIAGGFIGGSLYKKISEKATDKLFNIAQIIIFSLCIINIVRNI